MKLGFDSGWLRFELELFLPIPLPRKYQVLPPGKLFQIERRLLRRLRQGMRAWEDDSRLRVRRRC